MKLFIQLVLVAIISTSLQSKSKSLETKLEGKFQPVLTPIKKPFYLKNAPDSSLSYYQSSLNFNQLISNNKRSIASLATITLPLPSGNFDVWIESKTYHQNGDITLIGSLLQQDFSHRVIYTLGKSGGIADITGPNTHYQLTTSNNDIWVIDLTHPSISASNYINDTLGSLPNLTKNQLAIPSSNNTRPPIVVDTLLLYTDNIEQTFPNGMAVTLMNQLIAKANQAFVDSGTDLVLRLVGTQLVNYPKPSDFSALDDLRFELNNQATDPSLNGIRELRDNLGADLVSMIRTHNLNEREVCGVAVFPDMSTDVLINISNVGISGGSNCINTFTHEIGHNFGAGHQRFNGQSQGALSFSGAIIVANQFNTIMSSIGTGDINRNYKLNQFSNPNLTCAGLTCGNATVADNATTINTFAPQNAALRATVIAGTTTPPPPSNTDTDQDGISDQFDSFPFDPTETEDTDLDGVGDNSDAFPNNINETLDTDNDGLGNNADTDDDNDTVLDSNDALPLDPTETLDSDNDGIGNNADQLDNNPLEYLDADNDGIGDRLDLDDDNDGVNDFANKTNSNFSEVFVASANTNNVLKYNGATGAFIEEIFSVEIGALSFRSAIDVGPSGEIYLITFSDVSRYDRVNQQLDLLIDRNVLASNFPTELLFDSSGNLLINDGLKPSNLTRYNQWSTTIQANASLPQRLLRGMAFSGNELLALERGSNQILRINPTNLLENNVFASGAGLNLPEHISVSPSGDIFVSNAGDGTIARFNSQGSFLGIFVTASSGGLNTPSCMDFGPDGNLYVCSLNTDQILRYDGSTGAFIDVFIDQSSGLDKPVSIVFAGGQLDEALFDPTNDSDNDGTPNNQDDLPLDPTETVDTDNDGIGNIADTDDDGDGMPDSFEQNFGLNPLSASDANSDLDGDGNSNLQEFLDGTDPTDPNDFIEPSSSGGGGSFSVWLLFLLGMLRLSKFRK